MPFRHTESISSDEGTVRIASSTPEHMAILQRQLLEQHDAEADRAGTWLGLTGQDGRRNGERQYGDGRTQARPPTDWDALTLVDDNTSTSVSHASDDGPTRADPQESPQAPLAEPRDLRWDVNSISRYHSIFDRFRDILHQTNLAPEDSERAMEALIMEGRQTFPSNHPAHSELDELGSTLNEIRREHLQEHHWFETVQDQARVYLQDFSSIGGQQDFSSIGGLDPDIRLAQALDQSRTPAEARQNINRVYQNIDQVHQTIHIPELEADQPQESQSRRSGGRMRHAMRTLRLNNPFSSSRTRDRG